MDRETIFGVCLFAFCLISLIIMVVSGIRRKDNFYKIDGYYFKDKWEAQKYWETQQHLCRKDLFIYTYDSASKTRIAKDRCEVFFK